MRLTLSACSTVCLLGLWLVLISVEVAGNAHSQFDYRAHHDEAAAKVNGREYNNDGKWDRSHEAPRLRERIAREQQEPERWAQYVPERARTVAVEISEARREAREMEMKRAQAERQEQQEQRKEEQEERKEKLARQVKFSPKKESAKDQSTIKRAAQNVKAVTKRTGKRVQAQAERLLDFDEEDDEEDEEEDEEDDERASTYRSSKKRKASPGIAARIWRAIRWTFSVCYTSLNWSGRNLIWVPSTYAAEVVRWSAHTSWRTTRWTGERALVGPAMTVGAPVIYLVEGFLFLFVWTPARITSILVKELYPLYIFLGAALAVGTAMGIASAVILYIGSFFLTESSTIEENFSHRANGFPEDLHKRFQQQTKASPSRKWVKKGESILDKAMKESIERQQQKSQRIPQEQMAAGGAAESDEEDDYFGQAPDVSYKGKGRSNSDLTPTGSIKRIPNHFGPPLPVGATTGGGWSSANSSPAMSPISTRANLPNASSASYTSARARLSASPLNSPDIFRSGFSRQRRGVSTSM